jgi:transposase
LPQGSRRWEEIDAKLDAAHQARLVRRQLKQLDPEVLYEVYGGRGRAIYEPVAMLAMALYMLLQGFGSPAQWHKHAKDSEAVQWLGFGYQPARRTWYDFRDRLGDCIEKIHAQFVQLAIDQDLVDPSIGVQDGTSFAACASRHRMVNEETLANRKKLLEDLLNGEVSEDDELPKWVPSTIVGCEDLLDRVEQADTVIQQRIEENAKKPSDKRKDRDKIMVSLSDPDAPLGRDKQRVYRPLYTVQYVVEPTSLMVLGYQCDAAVCDTGTLAPMIDQVQEIVHGQLQCMMADAAYCTILDLRDCEERDVELLAPVQTNSQSKPKKNTNGVGLSNRDQFEWDPELQTYRCPKGHELKYHSKQKKRRHGDRILIQYQYRCPPEHCENCSLAGGCVRNPSKGRTVSRMEGQDLLDAQREKMKRPEIKEAYKLRGQTVELGFADAKANRRFDRYHGRGLTRVRTETGLLVLSQNLLRLDRLQRNAQNPDQNST